MNDEREYDVFLSYSSKDAQWADVFVESLRDSGIRPWSHVDIAPGEKWAERIESALRQSHTLVFILTPESLDSPWTFFEIGAAIGGKKRIIPIIADDLPPAQIPRLLAQFQFLRESSPQRAAERVAAVLKSVQAEAAA